MAIQKIAERSINILVILALWMAIEIAPPATIEEVLSMVYVSLFIVLFLSPALFLMHCFTAPMRHNFERDKFIVYFAFVPIVLLLSAAVVLFHLNSGFDTIIVNLSALLLQLLVVFYPLGKIFTLFEETHLEILLSFILILGTLFITILTHDTYVLLIGFAINEFVTDLDLFRK